MFSVMTFDSRSVTVPEPDPIDIDDSITNQVNTSAITRDGTRVALGYPGTNEVKVYGLSGGTWTLIQTLTEGTGSYGGALDMDDAGNWLVVGEWGNDTVYVYEWGGSSFGNKQTITVSQTYGSFGIDVGLSGDGNTLIIGSSATEFYVTNYNEGAYIYTNTGSAPSAWTVHTSNLIGRYVALDYDGDVAIVSGKVFDLITGTWTFNTNLAAEDQPDISDDGLTIAVGGSGNTYIYRESSGWSIDLTVGAGSDKVGIHPSGNAFAYTNVSNTTATFYEYDGSWSVEKTKTLPSVTLGDLTYATSTEQVLVGNYLYPRVGPQIYEY